MLTRRRTAELLRHAATKVPLFGGLKETQLASLLASATIAQYPKGTEVFAANEPATNFALVLEGALKVYMLSADGREHILHLAEPGDVVAEAAVFAEGTYPASAMATEDATIAHFHRDRLVALLRQDPELALAMIAGLSRRLREFVTTIEDLSLRDVTARLARFLLENARDGVCKLPGTKTQLAAQLGTVLEPLSRSFRRLKDEGLIEEGKAGVRIVDEAGLQELMEAGSTS